MVIFNICNGETKESALWSISTSVMGRQKNRLNGHFKRNCYGWSIESSQWSLLTFVMGGQKNRLNGNFQHLLWVVRKIVSMVIFQHLLFVVNRMVSMVIFNVCYG